MTEETDPQAPLDLDAPVETTEEAAVETVTETVEVSIEAGAEDEDDNSEITAAIAARGLTRMSLQELKEKSPADLLAFAETFEVENANSMRKQDMMFAILKALAEEGVDICGSGTLEVLQDGFGFLRSPESNYLAGPDDIYVSP